MYSKCRFVWPASNSVNRLWTWSVVVNQAITYTCNSCCMITWGYGDYSRRHVWGNTLQYEGCKYHALIFRANHVTSSWITRNVSPDVPLKSGMGRSTFESTWVHSKYFLMITVWVWIQVHVLVISASTSTCAICIVLKYNFKYFSNFNFYC